MRGNDLGAFEINSNNGLIRVRDPELIDFEKYKQFVLTVAGQGMYFRDPMSNCLILFRITNVSPTMVCPIVDSCLLPFPNVCSPNYLLLT